MKIRFAAMALVLAGVLARTASCNFFLHFFVSEEEAVFHGRLLGTWADEGEREIYIIRQDGKGYTITVVNADDGKVQRLKARMFEAGDVKLLDLSSAASDQAGLDLSDQLNTLYFNLPVDHIIRIWIQGSTLRWVALGSNWLQEQAGRELGSHKLYENPGHDMLVTASKDAVRAFLLKYGADDRAYLDPQRLGPAVNPALRCVGQQMS